MLERHEPALRAGMRAITTRRPRLFLVGLALALGLVTLLATAASAETTTTLDTTKDGNGADTANASPQGNAPAPPNLVNSGGVIDTTGDENGSVGAFGKPDTATYGQVVTVPSGFPVLK